MNVAEIDSSIHSLDAARHAVAHHVNTETGRCDVTERREAVLLAHRLLGDEGLGSSGLSLLGGDLLRLGNVCATIFSKVDPFACPCGFSGKCVNNLGRKRESIRLVIEMETRPRSYLGSNGDAQEMDESNVLVAHNLDLVNEAESAELISELLLGHILVEASNVDVPARIALANGKCHLCRDRRRLAPTDLELLRVQRQFLDGSIGVESCCGLAVEEGEEDTRLLGQHANGFKGAEVNQVEQFVDRSGCGEVSNVDRAPGSVTGCTHSGSEGDRVICSCSLAETGEESAILILRVRENGWPTRTSWTYLVKVGHLGVVREGAKHVHGGKTHPQHVVATEPSVAVSVGTGLLGLLLLLLLLDSERGCCSVGAQLGTHSGTVGLGVDGQRRGRVERAATEGSRGCAVGVEGLVDAGLGAVSIVCKCVPGGCCGIGGVLVGKCRVWGPARLLGIRTANGLH